MSALEEEFRFMLLFVEKIPNSSEISQNDIAELIERNFFALLALKLSYWLVTRVLSHRKIL